MSIPALVLCRHGQGQENAPEAVLSCSRGKGSNAPCLMISENLFDLEA